MTAYRRGADFERRVAAHLRGEGWLVIRAAGSHGVADVVALRAGSQRGQCETRLIQCKVGPRFSIVHRAALCSAARTVGATAWLAFRGKTSGRSAIVFTPVHVLAGANRRAVRAEAKRRQAAGAAKGRGHHSREEATGRLYRVPPGYADAYAPSNASTPGSVKSRESDGVRLISAQQLAEEFRVPVGVVYGWVRRWRLPYHRVDRRLLFDPDELRPWVPNLRASVLLRRVSRF